jgi:hypothetical protein
MLDRTSIRLVNQLKQFSDLPFAFKAAFIGLICLFAANVGLLVGLLPVKIDPGLATLFGAIIGLAIVAWQTNRGFKNLIRSQENQAALDRDGRVHQQQLDSEKSEREVAQRKQVLVAALWAEMVSLQTQIGDASNSAFINAEVAKGMLGQAEKNTSMNFIVHTYAAPIYKANIRQLGLLGASVAADVVTVASRATGPAFEEIKSEAFPSWEVLIALYQSHIEVMKDWLLDLSHVANRLRSLMDGTPDPGTLFADQQKREAKAMSGGKP